MRPYITLIIGAIIGWLFGTLYKKSGLGLLGNILIGILGAYVGYWAFRQVDVFFSSEALLSGIIRGAIGSVVILFLYNIAFKKRQ